MSNRAFKGIWISAEIWLNTDLSVMEKLFLVEIDSLDKEQGCFASNAHFAEFFDISKARCTQIIKSLESKNRLEIELERKGKVISKRIIRVVNKLNTPSKNSKHPIKNSKQGYLENAQGSNTSNNNTSNNNITSTGPTSEADASCPHEQIIKAYHDKLPTLRKVKVWNDQRKKFLRSRWRESPKHQTVEFWESLFDHISQSPFLIGNVNDFQCDLEWIVRPTNFVKIIEGKYHE